MLLSYKAVNFSNKRASGVSKRAAQFFQHLINFRGNTVRADHHHSALRMPFRQQTDFLRIPNSTHTELFQTADHMIVMN